jgi:hypothetical protein
MIHEVNSIQWDTDNENVDLPTTLKVNVPDGITERDDVIEYISNQITEMTDFCHFGFTLTT